MINQDALTFVCLFWLAACIIAIVWAEIENVIHRRKIRNASRNKGV
ncbi:hypothetical protein VC218_07025 [Xanthomonas nasturtii]|nr:hypothetical protein [Xanthomonas nasturtii]MEA9578674.1 hypothetical protein [Xanthomonas nasturtii]